MKKILSAVMWGVLACQAHAGQITGAGSTFVYPALSQWAAQYQKHTGTEINYQPIGSGAGVAQLKAKTVDFATSDKPLTPSELKATHLNQFPIIMGGIVVAENIPGVNQLTLDGQTISNIYLKKITQWNDPAIQALNPTVKLPKKAITVVYRADGSGTTYNFTHYLSAINPAFAKTVGSNTTVKFPVGIGGKGNSGVANYIKMIPGSVGYVEYAYAVTNHLSVATMKVGSNIVSPNMKSFSLAASQTKNVGGIYQFPLRTNQAWPMMAATYALLPQQNLMLPQVHAFFKYVFAHPEVATQLSYAAIASGITHNIINGWK